MPRYVDADKLYDKALKLEREAYDAMKKIACCDDYDKFAIWSAICGERISFKYDIADAPTEDVEPVKRGKWEWENGDSYESSGKRCSKCGVLKDSVYSNYCPNCGAKMEVEHETN